MMLYRTRGVKRLCVCGLLCAGVLLLGWVESLFPLPLPLPGVKLGLGNAFVVLALYLYGPLSALMVTVARVGLSSLLFAGLGALPYALAGGLLAWACMAAVYRLPSVSPVGASIAGAASHGLAQCAVGALITATPSLLLYATPLMLLGILTGGLLGYLADLCLKRLTFLKR